MRKFKVSKSGVGQRTDIFVASKFPEFTRAALTRLFDEKLVVIGGKPAKASYKLRAGDEVRVDDTLLKTEPEAVELLVLYEDNDVIVMNKPAGVLTHSKGALNDEATVASFLKTKITDENLTGNRAGIVHRLDRPTSGVIIGAKTGQSLKHLQKQFSDRKTKKTYLAVVEGWPEPAEAIIDAPIQRNPRKPQTFRVNAAGKAAQTHYQTLKRFNKGGKKYALLGLRPVTGRTHQIRVHLNYINHPIVGDHVYGQDGDRLMLHALSLELTLPNKERKVFKSEPPADFKEFVEL